MMVMPEALAFWQIRLEIAFALADVPHAIAESRFGLAAVGQQHHDLVDVLVAVFSAFGKGRVGRQQVIAELGAKRDMGPGIGSHGVELVADGVEIIRQRSNLEAIRHIGTTAVGRMHLGLGLPPLGVVVRHLAWHR